MDAFPFGGLGFAVFFAALLLGVAAGLRRILRKPALELTPVDRLIASMLLGRFFGPLRARFHPGETDGKPLPNLACPLCGAPNACAPAQQGIFAGECWCTKVSVSAEALARIPEASRGKACLCRTCAVGKKTSSQGAASAAR